MLFYTTDKRAPLPHNPFNALVAPRPIGWISTLDNAGRANLAPFSFFNAVSYTPPQVIFSGGGRVGPRGVAMPVKDSVANAEATGEFVVNLCSWALREAMNATSEEVPPGTDEFALAGLEKLPARLVKPPRVAGCPAHLECRTVAVIPTKSRPGHTANRIVLGEVVGVHIDEAILTGGIVDQAKLQLIGRLGHNQYCRVSDVFALDRPTPER